MRHIKIISVILIILSTFISCQKLPINGKLDGMWQLMRVNGERVERQTYISFQLHLVQLTYGDTKNEFYYCHFKKEHGTMRFYDFSFPCKHENWEQDNVPLKPEEAHLVEPFGMYGLDVTYHIDVLTNQHLVLSNDDVKLEYRKF